MTSASFPSSDANSAKRFGDLHSKLVLLGIESVAGLPLFGSDGHIIGSIGFAFAQPQLFEDQQRSFLETVADIAGQSLDRALLYERERDVASNRDGNARYDLAFSARAMNARDPTPNYNCPILPTRKVKGYAIA